MQSERYLEYNVIILSDIFAPKRLSKLTRLSNPRKTLHDNSSVQQVTVVALHLLQSSAFLPHSLEETAGNIRLIKEKYEMVCSVGEEILKSLLMRQVGQPKNNSFRHVFRNVCVDLVTMLHKPEWPSAAFLLDILARILVEAIGDQTLLSSVRTAAIQYLGLLAAGLHGNSAACSVDVVSQRFMVKKVIFK